MKQFFKELFEYNQHVNQKLQAAFIENANKTPEKAIILFNHILNAHYIWNSRIEGKQIVFDVWHVDHLEGLKNNNNINYEQTLLLIEKFDLNLNVNYTNSKGQLFCNSVRDILFHVINHSTYHRAQIASEFKQQGLAPLPSDYIFYKR